MKQIKRLSIYATILIFLFLEITIFNRLRIFGVKPEMLLVVTIFFGFHFGTWYGMEVSIISGVLKDIFSVSRFGMNAFSFLFIGFLSSYCKKKLFKENFVTQFLLASLSFFLVSGIYFFDLDKIGQEDITLQFFGLSLCKGLYTGFMAPFLFFILTKIFEGHLDK